MASNTSTSVASKEFVPHLYPPFPQDITPCAELDTFSLAKLHAGDQAEQVRLLETCKRRGFFYLDFDRTSVETLPKDAEAIGRFSEEMFGLAMEEKMKFKQFLHKPNSILGYKLAGWSKTDALGTPDTAEFMNIGKDDVLDNAGRTPVSLPAIALQADNRELLCRYQRACHRIGLDIMSVLAAQLGLPRDVFEDTHRITEPSDDHIRLTRGPARKSVDQVEIQTPGHTDFGTITILFNWLGGLQVWSQPSRGNFHQLFDGTQSVDGPAGQWLWVRPKPGRAIINLGDAAVKFTGGILCSGRHRVVPAPGRQGLWPRYSVVYFVRPEDDCVLKKLKGGRIAHVDENETEGDGNMTASQWIWDRALVLKDGNMESTSWN